MSLPRSGIIRRNYDAAVIALTKTPGEWVPLVDREYGSGLRRRFERHGFQFASRKTERGRITYGRFVGDNFNEDAFYDSLRPYCGKDGRRAAA